MKVLRLSLVALPYACTLLKTCAAAPMPMDNDSNHEYSNYFSEPPAPNLLDDSWRNSQVWGSNHHHIDSFHGAGTDNSLYQNNYHQENPSQTQLNELWHDNTQSHQQTNYANDVYKFGSNSHLQQDSPHIEDYQLPQFVHGHSQGAQPQHGHFTEVHPTFDADHGSLSEINDFGGSSDSSQTHGALSRHFQAMNHMQGEGSSQIDDGIPRQQYVQGSNKLKMYNWQQSMTDADVMRVYRKIASLWPPAHKLTNRAYLERLNFYLEEDPLEVQKILEDDPQSIQEAVESSVGKDSRKRLTTASPESLADFLTWLRSPTFVVLANSMKQNKWAPSEMDHKTQTDFVEVLHRAYKTNKAKLGSKLRTIGPDIIGQWYKSILNENPRISVEAIQEFQKILFAVKKREPKGQKAIKTSKASRERVQEPLQQLEQIPVDYHEHAPFTQHYEHVPSTQYHEYASTNHYGQEFDYNGQSYGHGAQH